MKRMWDGFIAKLTAWKKRKADLVLRMTIKRGVALDKKGKSEEAIAYFDDVLRTDPKNAIAWSFKAGALLKLGRMHEAKADFQNYIKYAKPEHAVYVAQTKELIRDIEAIMNTGT